MNMTPGSHALLHVGKSVYYHIYIYGNHSLELGEDIELFVWCKTFA